MDTCTFIELNNNSLTSVDGGWSPANIAAAYGTFSATCDICTAIGGDTVLDMGVGALAACGPVGWGILAVGAVGGVATGYVLTH
jgi:hypothetical protein